MIYRCPFETDLFTTDHAKQTTFITNQFITDHIHNRLVHIRPVLKQIWSWQKQTFTTYHVHNRPIINVVCHERNGYVINWSGMNVVYYERVCYELVCHKLVCSERGMLWTSLILMWSVMNWFVMNVVCFEWSVTVCLERE